MNRWGAALAGSGGALALAQAGPVVTSIRPVRMAISPGLAGAGRRADRVAFTFDDGPDPQSTPRFLELLADRGVTATFFLLGFMVRRAPGLVHEIAAAGHEIGVHGYSHRNLLLRGPVGTRDDLARARDLIADHAGTVPRWYRPPYGVLTTSAAIAARQLGMRPVLWTSWGWDWSARATPDSVHRTVLRRLDGGGTVLLHDADCTSAPGSWRNTLAALPRLLDECDRRGWRTTGLTEHLLG